MASLKDTFLYFYLPKYHKLFLKNKPVVLVNSVQKAGTHMLTNALAAALPLKYNERGTYNHALTRGWLSEKAHKNTSASSVIGFLENQAWPGEIIRGHIEYDQGLSAFLSEKTIPHLLIVRKPLDVLLSLANWWERHSEIPVIPFLTYKAIDTKEARLQFLVSGKHDGAVVWPDFVTRYSAFSGWLNCPHTLAVRYEDVLAIPAEVAQKIEAYVPMGMNKARFVSALSNKENRTYTLPEDKVFKTLPESIVQQYYALGGAALENQLGY